MIRCDLGGIAWHGIAMHEIKSIAWNGVIL